MEKINSQAWYLVKNGEANEAFELRDFSIDSINTDEVVVETEGFGLNYADIMARRGLYQAAPPLPAVPSRSSLQAALRAATPPTKVKSPKVRMSLVTAEEV